jgi:phosphoglycerate dehydrogenase-like enzyme
MTLRAHERTAASRLAASTRFSRNATSFRCTCAWPHIGYVTREEYEIQFADIFDQITAYASGKPINVVNPEVLESADKGT